MKMSGTYTATGNKATVQANLPDTIFGITVANHDILKDAYVAYLANDRSNLAVTKRRGEVRGGGKKPWKQKGTGRARFGSSRVPIWRGGGIVFGPTGEENYTKKMSTTTKRTALKQALSLAVTSNKVKIVLGTGPLEGKTKDLVKFLDKLDANGTVLYVVTKKDSSIQLATRNIANLKVTSAGYLTVYDILNADTIVFNENTIEKVTDWLGVDTPKAISKKPAGVKK